MELGIDKKIDDIIPLLGKVWGDRRRLMRNCGIAAVVALVVAFSIPKEFESTVVLAPESSSGGSFSGLSSLASFAGINMNEMQGADALYPELYPQITNSTVFLSDLYSMQVSSEDGELNTTLYDYISSQQSSPWWEHIFLFPLKLKVLLMPDKRVSGWGESESVTYCSYSKQQHSGKQKRP